MGYSWTWQLESDPTTGRPLQSKSVVCVEAEDHGALMIDLDLTDVTAE
jgi:hypothetical protein